MSNSEATHLETESGPMEPQVELEETTEGALVPTNAINDSHVDFDEDGNPRSNLRAGVEMDSETLNDGDCSDPGINVDVEAMTSQLEKENEKLRCDIEGFNKLSYELDKKSATLLKEQYYLKREKLEMMKAVRKGLEAQTKAAKLIKQIKETNKKHDGSSELN